MGICVPCSGGGKTSIIVNECLLMLDDKYFGFKGVFAQLKISVNKLETHSVYHLDLRLNEVL